MAHCICAFLFALFLKRLPSGFMAAATAAVTARATNTTEVELQHARDALVQITWHRICKLWPVNVNLPRDVSAPDAPDAGADQPVSLDARLTALLAKHGVPGCQVAVLNGLDAPVQTIVAGLRDRAENAPVTEDTWFQIASCSKTVGTAFALEEFARRGLSIDTPVNHVRCASGVWVALYVLLD
jgi:CubicO group peptidase (beta-lactamase class C family)